MQRFVGFGTIATTRLQGLGRRARYQNAAKLGVWRVITLGAEGLANRTAGVLAERHGAERRCKLQHCPPAGHLPAAVPAKGQGWGIEFGNISQAIRRQSKIIKDGEV